MTFDAKCKSFKIFAAVLGLLGATLVADCRAERNPVSPVLPSKLSVNHEVVTPKMVAQLEEFKRDRRRTEKRWSAFKQFAGQQANVANDKLSVLGLSEWWKQPIGPIKKPVVRQQMGSKSIAISPAALLVKFAGNMSAIQWWQVASKTTALLEATEQRMVNAKNKLQADFQASMMRLAKTSSDQLVQQFDRVATNSLVRRILSGDSEQLTAKQNESTESVTQSASADPYWSYYSDCDFWGAQFNQAHED